jgi:hypothetical protein
MLATVVLYLSATHELRDPWLYHYIFAVPASHPLRLRLFVRGVFFLPVTVPVVCALACVPLFAVYRAPSRALIVRFPWAVTFFAWLLPTLLFRTKQGASINFFLPLLPVAVLAAVEGAGHLANTHCRGTRLLRYLPALQLLALPYDPRPAIPTREDERATAGLVERLRNVQGDVWFPAFPSYAALAGKPWLSQEVALTDLEQLHPGLVDASIAKALRSGPLRALVLRPDTVLVDRKLLAGFPRETLPVPRSPFSKMLYGPRPELVLVSIPALPAASERRAAAP